MNDLILIIGLIAVGFGALWWVLATTSTASTSESRESGFGPFRSWLQRAGFRSRHAVSRFVLAAVLAAAVGAILALLIATSPLVEIAMGHLREIPGGFGEAMIPILSVAPFIVFIIPASIPWIYVRASRRRRIREIDEDLPMTLELLATLAQSGLGFDSALGQVLESSTQRGTLHAELETYRRECIAGVSRQRALKKLSGRVEVASLSMVVAALVQSERVGSGISSVLRSQANEVRSARKQKAQLAAHTLPVKLMFPLVICFLPAIFVATLGPAFYSFFELAESVIQQGR